MTFGRRLRYYLLGFFAGSIMVFMIFGRRSSCKNYVRDYLPNGRVLQEVQHKPIQYSEGVEKFISENNIDSAFLNRTIMTEGEINFEDSEPRKKPCGYYKMTYKDSLLIEFEKCKDFSTIEKIYVK